MKMNNEQQLRIFNDFLQSWKEYTEFYKTKVKDSIEDLTACEAVLSELASGFPGHFLHSYLYGIISDKMLKRAEEFDNNLFRVKLIAANLDQEKKEIAKSFFRQVESFLAFCARCKAQQEGKWESE